VKSAWIETTGLDKSKYITVNAMVSTFDKTVGWRWTPDGGLRPAELASVGMHVASAAFSRWRASNMHEDAMNDAQHSQLSLSTKKSSRRDTAKIAIATFP
jgi:hypothetical protein